MMNQLTLKKHGPLIKQMLIQKLKMDGNENGKEITLENTVKQTMQRYQISKSMIHKLIFDFPIQKLNPLNPQLSKYLIEICGNLGGQSIHIQLIICLDPSGLDVRVKNLMVKR